MVINTTRYIAARADGINTRKAQNQIQYQGMSGDLYTSLFASNSYSDPAGTGVSSFVHIAGVIASANNTRINRFLIGCLEC